MNIFIGLAVATALLALIPSKAEAEWPVPWASIGFAVLSGMCAAVATGVH